MKRILAIRFARLGDVILLLPALSIIKASLPNSHLSLLVGHRCAPIGEMCPAIDEVISVDRVAMRDGPAWRALHDVRKLVSDIRSRDFDAVIDFHSFRETNLLTWFSRASFRLGMRRHDASYLAFCFNRPPVDEDKSLHVSEMFRRIAQAVPGVNAEPVSGPCLLVPESARNWAEEVLPRKPRITFYIDAPVDDRRWPAANFAAVAAHVADRWGVHPVFVSGSSGGALLQSIDNNHQAYTCLSDLTLVQLAAVVSSSQLLVSNDTGPMHLGPAVKIPTLGLFSVGLPEHFRPIGRQDRFVIGQPITKISVEQVIREVEQMWTTVGPDLQR